MQQERKHYMKRIDKIIDKIAWFSFVLVAVGELLQQHWMAGLGWFTAAVGWWAYDGEKKFFDQMCELYSKHLGKCGKFGMRNCDVYDTFETAKAACFKDRGYCSSPIAERNSVIRFMLQDVKDNAENKIEPEKEDGK